MLEVDLHTHSLFSLCGLHTIVEMLTQAKKLGMKALAITDHGKTLGGRLSGVFFERLQEPIPGIKLLKGIESNVLDQSGNIDCPTKLLKYMDVVLLGIHPNIQNGLGIKAYTKMLITAIEKNRYVDVITHPNDPYYPINFKTIAECAKQNDLALELNNSKIMLNRVSVELTEDMLTECKNTGCFIAVNSDAHALNEIGLDDSVTPLLKNVNFPEELIINRNMETALDFINRKKLIKMKYY